MTLEIQSIRLWRVPMYPTWFVSDAAKELANALLYFAVPLIALIVTGSPIQAGIVGAVGSVVGLTFTLGGGVLADRHRRSTMMLVGALLGILLTGSFALLDLMDALTFAGLVALNALLAMRSGLFDMAGEVALKEIVPDAAMGRAQAANQARGASIGLIAGPLGGMLLAVGGWLVALVALFCHLVGFVAAWMLRTSIADGRGGPAEGGASVPHGSALIEIRDGFTWLFARADLRGVMWIALIINLGFNGAVTTTIYALQQSGHPLAVIGLVSTALGGFTLLGAVLAPPLVSRVGGGFILIASLVASTVGTAALPFVESVPAILAVIGASVLFVPALNSALMGYFMVAVPTEILGRANSALRMLVMGAGPLVPLIAGFGLTWIGRERTILVCAVLCLVAGALAVGNKALRALPVESRWAEHARQYETLP